MICRNCGAENPDTTRACPLCDYSPTDIEELAARDEQVLPEDLFRQVPPEDLSHEVPAKASMTRMPQELIDALRSGDYPHGVGYLKRKGAFCCLGVAAELIDPDNTHGWADPDADHSMPLEDWDWYWAEWPWLRPMLLRLVSLNDPSLDFERVIAWLEAHKVTIESAIAAGGYDDLDGRMY